MTDMKNNFNNMHQDHLCQLCKAEEDDRGHLLSCEVLINSCEALGENTKVEYEDIFASLKEQTEAIKIVAKIWKTRENLMDGG